MRQHIISNVKSAFNQFSSALDGMDSSSSQKEDQSHTQDSSEDDTQESSQEETPQSLDAGTLGNYEVAILGARKSSDYEGKPVVIVKYKFTNHAEENKIFMASISGKVFQNGSQLESAILAGSDETYNSQDSMKEVQPEGTLEVEQAYILSDESADLTVEVSELISLSKDKLTKTFSLSDLE